MSEKPVLYYLMMSPPCRSVLLTAAALDVELELKVVNVSAGEQLEPEFLAVIKSTKNIAIYTHFVAFSFRFSADESATHHSIPG